MSWELSDNIKPVQAGAMGNCSACCLRNMDKDKFCKKMRCYDENSGRVVYWTTVNPGEYRAYLMGLLPDGMADWFNARSVKEVRSVVTEYMKRAYEDQK